MRTLYGLPEKVEFCKLCTISNQRPSSVPEFLNKPEDKKPTIHFTDGVCDACLVAEKKKQTDWEQREKELIKLCDKFRRNDGRYDCLVPGSGGKDSVYAAHMMRKYGMHPLTCTWTPNMYTSWGRANHDAWISEFDNILMTPNKSTHRLLTRLAVDNLLHPFQPFILGQKNLAPKIAALYDINLVIYGEGESEYGNPIKESGSATRDTGYYTAADTSNISLGGVSVDNLISTYGLTMADLQPYFPAKPNENVEVHYLGYYLKWHPQSCYYFATEHGFIPSPERTPGTYSKYNSIDDMIDDQHYFTTYIKFGIGRATYDSSQEIRSGDIDREEGVALVKRYDGEYPVRFEKEIFDYLNIEGFPKYDRESYLAHCEKFKSPHLWEGNKLRHTVWS